MKRFTAILLSFTVCFILFGCSKNSIQKSKVSSHSSSSKKDEIVWVTDKYAAVDGDLVEKLNSLLKKRGYNFRVSFKKIEDNWESDSLLPTIMELKNSGQQADLIYSGVGNADKTVNNYYDFVKNGIYTDLTQMLSTESGRAVKNAIDDKIWKGITVNGKIYGVRVQGYVAVPAALGFNKEIVNKYHLDISNPSADLWDYEDMLKKVYEGEKTNKKFSALVLLTDLSNNCLMNYDAITKAIGINLMDPSAKAVNMYEQDYVKKWFITIKRYRDLGFICDNPDNYFMRYEGYFAESGTEGSGKYKVNMLFRKIGPLYAKQSAVNHAINGIASWSENKENAFEMLKLCTTDKDIANLLVYGIEGQNYTLKDGKVVPNKNDYHDPINQMFFANNLLLYSSPEFGIDMSNCKEYNASAKESPILGFFFDDSRVKKEVKATDAVVAKYTEQLWDGEEANAEETLAQMQRELKAAGIDKVLDEVNRQIEAWKTVNK
ncbi:putative secreted protein [[Clostridium] cellulosi]|uniref:Putative secreted protein n=1 Tax=[Clostridium] cellulosi TaxID=29343 RepID=A0A078KM51_9FIRM|nr:putative secreted protein [[Clostridium] cellulosi]